MTVDPASIIGMITGGGMLGAFTLVFRSQGKQIESLQTELGKERESCGQRLDDQEERFTREIQRLDKALERLAEKQRSMTPRDFPKVTP